MLRISRPWASAGSVIGLFVFSVMPVHRAAAQCVGSWIDAGSVPVEVSDYYALAYDSFRDRVVLFGGFRPTGTARSDTVEWDGAGWTLLPVTGPAPRGGCPAIYDPERRQIVLFGGTDGTLYSDETWVFDGNLWARLPVTGPSARAFHSFVYDDSRHEGVLFGGRDATGYLDDCWRWQGTQWVRVDGPTPPARARHASAFDRSRGIVVVFGGTAGTYTYLGDTWEWDGSAWAHRAAVGPEPRADAAMVYDETLGRVLNIGGVSRDQTFQYDYFDLWTWGGSAWSVLPEPYYFSNSGHAAVFDQGRRAVIVGPGRHGGFATRQTLIYAAPSRPHIGRQPDPQMLCAEARAVFTIQATGPDPKSYRWRHNGMPLVDGPTGTGSVISGASATTLEIEGVGLGDEGAYDCIASNGCGETASDEGQLRVCRADLSCDGVIDFIDYLEFLNLYETADPRVDFTEDGIVDFADYLEFLNRYEAGC